MAKNNYDNPFQGLDSLSDDLFGTKASVKKPQESVVQKKSSVQPKSPVQKSSVQQKSAAQPKKSAGTDAFEGLDDLSEELFGKKTGGAGTQIAKQPVSTQAFVSGGFGKSKTEEKSEIDYEEFDIPDCVLREDLRTGSTACAETKKKETKTQAVKPVGKGKETSKTAKKEEVKPAAKTVAQSRQRGEDVATLIAPFGKAGDKEFSLELSGRDALLAVDGKNRRAVVDKIITTVCSLYSPSDLEVVIYAFESKETSSFAEYIAGGKAFVPHVTKIKFITTDGFPVLDCLDEIENEELERAKLFENKGYADFSAYIADCRRKSELPQLKRILYVFYNADVPFGANDDAIGSLVRAKFEVLLTDAEKKGISVIVACPAAAALGEDVADAFESKITADETKKGNYEINYEKTCLSFDGADADSVYDEATAVRKKFSGSGENQTVEEI